MLLSRNRLQELFQVWGFQALPQCSQDRGEAVLLGIGGARALVESPVEHRVSRAGIETARTCFADAHLLGDARVGLELELGQDAGQVGPQAGHADEHEQEEPGGEAPLHASEHFQPSSL